MFLFLTYEYVADKPHDDHNLQFVKKFGKKYQLTEQTMKILIKEELTSDSSLALLSKPDIQNFGLTIGQRNMLMAAVLDLQKSSSTSASDGVSTSAAANLAPVNKVKHEMDYLVSSSHSITYVQV